VQRVTQFGHVEVITAAWTEDAIGARVAHRAPVVEYVAHGAVRPVLSTGLVVSREPRLRGNALVTESAILARRLDVVARLTERLAIGGIAE
jgi:hypothetical protein